MHQSDLSKLSLFPLTKDIDSHGHLHIGGCDCVELVKKFGTPLYVFDEVTLHSKCQEFKTEFAKRYSNTLIIYASKAFLNQALATIFKEEGLRVILTCLENKCHLNRRRIAEEPEDFSAGLDWLLSSARPMVEKLILENLYSKLELKFEEKEGYKFSDYVKELKEK